MGEGSTGYVRVRTSGCGYNLVRQFGVKNRDTHHLGEGPPLHLKRFQRSHCSVLLRLDGRVRNYLWDLDSCRK